MINFNIEDGNRMIKQNKIIIVTKRNNKTLFRVIQFMKITRMSRDNKEVAQFLRAQSEVASGCYDDFLTFGTYIKTINHDYGYGYFTVTEHQDLFEAEKLSEENIFSLQRAYIGSFTQVGTEELNEFEVKEMLNLMNAKLSNISCLVGVAQPKHSKTGVSKENPFGDGANQSEKQMEEFVNSIGDNTYIFITLIQPLPPVEGEKFLKNIEVLQGNIEKDAEYGLNVGASITLPLGFNTGGNENVTDGYNYGTNNGWNGNFTDSWGENLNENFTVGEGWSDSDSLALSNSISETAGINNGTSYNGSVSANENWGVNENYGISNSDTTGYNFSQGYTEGDTLGETYGTSRNGSFSDSYSENYSLSNSSSENTNLGISLNRGTSLSAGLSEGSSDSYGYSGNYGDSKGFGWTENQGLGLNENFGLNKNGSANMSDNLNNNINASAASRLAATFGSAQTGRGSFTPGLDQNAGGGQGYGWGRGFSFGDGANYGAGANYNEGQSLSENSGKNWGYGENANAGFNVGKNSNWAVNDGVGSNLGLGRGTSLGYTAGIGYSGGITYGEGENDSLSYSKNNSNSVTNGASWSQALSENIGKGKNQGIGISETAGYGSNWGNSLSLATSDSTSHTKSLGSSGNTSNSWGKGENIGKSYSTGKSTGESEGLNFSWGKGTQWGSNIGLSPAFNIGINKTIRNYELKRFAEILNNYRLRLSVGLKKGIFLVQSFLITEERKANVAGKMGLRTALAGDTPFRINVFDIERNKDMVREKIVNFEIIYDKYEDESDIRKYKYITHEDAESLAAKIHIPRINYGGLVLTESYPSCNVPIVKEGPDTIELGKLIIPEEGGVSKKVCRITANRYTLNHGLFSGITGCGKSETVKTFITQLAKLKVENAEEIEQKGGSSSLASGIIIDWKKDHRGLLNVLPKERTAFYTLGSKLNPLKQNILAVPPGVEPFEHFSQMGEGFCLANQLGGKSSTMIYSNATAYCGWGKEIQNKLEGYLKRLEECIEMIDNKKVINSPIKMMSLARELKDGINKMLAYKTELISIDLLKTKSGIDELRSKFNRIPTADDIISYNSRYITLEHLYYVLEVEKIFLKFDGNIQTDMAEAYERITERFKQFKDSEVLRNNFCYNLPDQVFITQLLEEDRWIILEAEKIKSNNELKKFIIYVMTSDIYNYACTKDSKGEKFNNIKCIFFEEAAEIMPTREGNSGKQVLDVPQDIYEKIFTQGRGYGLRCYVVVQYINDLKEKIVASAPTSFFMRTDNAADMDIITTKFGKVHTMDARDVEYKKILPHLPIGEVVMKNSAVVNQLGDAEPFIFKSNMVKMHVPTDEELINMIEQQKYD